MDEKNMMRANILEKLIEKIMGGGFDPSEEESQEGAKDSPMEEMSEGIDGEKKPNAEVKMLSIEADPKKKMMGC